MREHMRNSDVAMRNIEGMPEGFNHLRRAYETMEPMMQGMGSEANTASNPFAALLNNAGNSPGSGVAGGRGADGGPNNTPFPNPWSPSPPATGAGGVPANPFASLGGLPGVGGGALGGMDPSAMMSMMQQPEMQAVMQQMLGNPQFMEIMLNMDPNMRRLVDTAPGMREMFSDPNMLRAMFNPQIIQAATQARMGAGGAIPGAPVPSPTAQPDMSQLFSLLGSMGGGGAGGLGGLSNMLGGMGGAGVGIPPVSNPEVAYVDQLQQLADMGFVDRAANIRALCATQGNVNAAVERLLGGV